MCRAALSASATVLSSLLLLPNCRSSAPLEVRPDAFGETSASSPTHSEDPGEMEPQQDATNDSTLPRCKERRRGSNPFADLPADGTVPSSLSIRRQVTPGYVGGPQYSITIEGGGRVKWRGTLHNNHPDFKNHEVHCRLAQSEMRQLAAVLERVGFQNLKPTYYNARTDVSEQRWFTTSLTTDKGSWKVERYEVNKDAPDDLVQLEQFVEWLAAGPSHSAE